MRLSLTAQCALALTQTYKRWRPAERKELMEWLWEHLTEEEAEVLQERLETHEAGLCPLAIVVEGEE